jgi:DHA1 family tetracycline resistance protein-like MFS transporter
MSRKTGQAALGFILVTVLIDVIGLGIIIPVLPALIRELIGGDLSQASAVGGWLMFSYAVMQFLCAPVLGNLSDRFGRRPVLLMSLFGFGLDYILLAVAPTIGWLFVGRILAGITGASITTASAYIADISTPDKRAQHFGLMGAMFGLGFIIGPMLGGILGQWGSRMPFMVSAGLAFLNWLYGYFVLPESLPADRRRAFDWKRAHPFGSLKHLRKYPAISSLVLSLTMVYIAIHAVQTTWSYYNIGKFGWDEQMVGYSLAFVGLLVAIVQGGLIRVILPRFGAKRSLLAGLMTHATGLLLFAFATDGWMMFVFSLVYCFGGIAGPALQSIISGQVPANEQGELQGSLTSLMSLTSIIGPLLMTSLYARFTSPEASFHFPGAPFAMGSLLFLTGAVLSLRSFRKPSPPPQTIM